MECGFIHALWYSELERAIPFPGLKTSQCNPLGGSNSSHLMAYSLVLSREGSLLKAHWSPWLLSYLGAADTIRGVWTVKETGLKTAFYIKKIKLTNQHYLPSVPDRADVK